MFGRGSPAQTKKQKDCHIDRMGDISKDAGNEIPHTCFGMTIRIKNTL